MIKEASDPNLNKALVKVGRTTMTRFVGKRGEENKLLEVAYYPKTVKNRSLIQLGLCFFLNN